MANQNRNNMETSVTVRFDGSRFLADIHINGIDIENDSFTVREFVKLTKNDYGGSTIRKIME